MMPVSKPAIWTGGHRFRAVDRACRGKQLSEQFEDASEPKCERTQNQKAHAGHPPGGKKSLDSGENADAGNTKHHRFHPARTRSTFV
jgi:hypothetical protein